MLPKQHRLIGIIRIEASVPDISGGNDDDSTIGGLLAGFAQRSLFADMACRFQNSSAITPRALPSPTKTGTRVPANLEQLTRDLQAEFLAFSDVSA